MNQPMFITIRTQTDLDVPPGFEEEIQARIEEALETDTRIEVEHILFSYTEDE